MVFFFLIIFFFFFAIFSFSFLYITWISNIKHCLQITFSGHTRIFTGPNGWPGGPFGPPLLFFWCACVRA